MKFTATPPIAPKRIHWSWHVAIWIAYSLFWTLVLNEQVDIIQVLGQLIFVFYNAGLVYFNAYFLIPKLLNAGRILLYLLALLAALLLASVGLAYTMYLHLTYICHCDGSHFLDLIGSAGPTLGSNVSVLMVSIPIHLYRQRKALQAHQREQEKNHLKTELKVLKDQLNPHFLFNALNNIYFLIKKDPKDAAEALAGLSDLLRYQLYETDGEMVPLEKEMDNLLQFCRLAQLRKSADFRLEQKIEARWNGHLIAPLLLLPLVENAFKYTDHSDSFIRLEAGLEQDTFVFEVSNPLSGIRQEKKTPGGIGLSNLERRLALLYPNRHQLDIRPGPEQYRVRLTLQLDTL